MLVTRFVLAIVASLLLVGPGANGASAQDMPAASIVAQTGHTFKVHTVAFSPDGHTALSGGMDSTLRLWDVASGRQLRLFSGHTSDVTSAAFFPDGRTAISGGGDSTLRLWDVDTGRELRIFKGHTAAVRSLAVSRDGRTVLSGSEDTTLKLWDASTGMELRSFKGHTGKVTAITLSPDGRTVVSGSEDNSLKLWDIATGSELRTFASGTVGITSVAFSPNGRTVLCGQNDIHAIERMQLAIERIGLAIQRHQTILDDNPEDNPEPSVSLWDVDTGRKLRAFASELGVAAVAFSPDGRIAASGSVSHLHLWDTASWKKLPNSPRKYDDTVECLSLAFTAGGDALLIGGFPSLKIWDIAAGKVRLTFAGHDDSLPYLSPESLPSGDNYEEERRQKEAEKKASHNHVGVSNGVHFVGVSPDGRTLLAGSRDSMLKLWDLTSGRLLRTFQGRGDMVTSADLSADGRTILSVYGDKQVKIWDARSGGDERSFLAAERISSPAKLSPDGRIALAAGEYDDRSKYNMKLWDIATGKELSRLKGHTLGVESASFSPDSRTVLTASYDGTVRIWDAATGAEILSFKGHGEPVTMAAFSADGRTVLSGSEHGGMKIWEAATGRELSSFKEEAGHLCAVAFSADGRTVLTGHGGMGMKLRDAATGAVIRTFRGHTSMVCAVAFVPGGRLVVSGSEDGTLRVWDAASAREITRMMATGDGEWLSITPEGFFTGSDRDTTLLNIVRGSEIITAGQVHQSLFNPDLVREALAGDPDEEVALAAKAVNLDKVLDAGPAPAVTITSHQNGSRTPSDAVTVTARIADRGKGIGRIEWRVNGVTSGVTAVPAGPGPDYTVSRELALDPGKNEIEVIAYEKRNILASPAARALVSYAGLAGTAKPKLHVLAIGVNAYADEGWTPPGATERLAFGALHLAVDDARAFGAEMKKAGSGLYSEVRVVEALDADVTPAKIGELIKQMAAGIGPRDTFVFYAAAHGYSAGGRYYLIPQDYQGGNDPRALKSRAIGQDMLQDWIANNIKARKGVILLDTCESGALVGGYTKSRTDVPSSEAAIGRLHEATGRPVLTAAATGKPAFEGYKGHGVFTYALMEALHRGDTNNDGKIALTELAAHVEKRVPELAAELGEHGGVVKGVTVIAARGAGGDKQSAHFGSTGEDFAIVARLP